MSAFPFSRDPASLRPQPRRNGADFWPTLECLIGALIERVLPVLPQASIWECAAGDGRPAVALCAAGYHVLASDIEPRSGGIVRVDFLHDEPRQPELLAVTNPPFNALDRFLARGLQLLDFAAITGLVLLVRCDALFAASRADAFSRAASIFVCCWRSVWIEGTRGNGRWASAWVRWLPDSAGLPVVRWLLPERRQRQDTLFSASYSSADDRAPVVGSAGGAP
jgi:hypothetical protein